jgi:hypothetical protein
MQCQKGIGDHIDDIGNGKRNMVSIRILGYEPVFHVGIQGHNLDLMELG